MTFHRVWHPSEGKKVTGGGEKGVGEKKTKNRAIARDCRRNLLDKGSQGLGKSPVRKGGEEEKDYYQKASRRIERKKRSVKQSPMICQRIASTNVSVTRQKKNIN